MLGSKQCAPHSFQASASSWASSMRAKSTAALTYVGVHGYLAGRAVGKTPPIPGEEVVFPSFVSRRCADGLAVSAFSYCATHFILGGSLGADCFGGSSKLQFMWPEGTGKLNVAQLKKKQCIGCHGGKGRGGSGDVSFYKHDVNPCNACGLCGCVSVLSFHWMQRSGTATTPTCSDTLQRCGTPAPAGGRVEPV